MWTTQRESGDWKWPINCRWPPMESDEHYGVTLAAIAAGAAPDNYAQTPAAQAGLTKIRRFLADHPPVDLHHKGMILWAASYVDQLVTDGQRKLWIDELLAVERPGGAGVSRRFIRGIVVTTKSKTSPRPTVMAQASSCMYCVAPGSLRIIRPSNGA